MKSRVFCLYSLALIALIVFLFVNAPAPLPVSSATSAHSISIEEVFSLLEEESDAVRGVWTKDIVRAGTQSGLEFSEEWLQKSVEAGPLPALFLREIAKNMERSRFRLSLFLGSDFPISTANQFSGGQLDNFRRLKASLQPQFFREPDTGLYTGMFADVAISKACIDCHNDHPDTPKSDWQLQEVMGATTWMYPQQQVTLQEALQLLQLFRSSVAAAYTRYLDKVTMFASPPQVGTQWPSQGYFLPDAETFITATTERASAATIRILLRTLVQDEAKP
jgi:adenylate cyclase